MRFIPAAVLLVMVAAGCASSPDPRYYTLDMTPSGNVELKHGIAIDRIYVHESLARPDILIKTSPTEIEYYAFHRWAASLAELVGEKLSAEFRSDAAVALDLSANLMAFEQLDREGGADGHVRIEIEVRPTGARRESPPQFKRLYDVSIPADSATPGATVIALSRALETVAEQAAGDINALQ